VSEQQAPERWAIVSLLGHQERIGRVSEEVVAGAAMLRIDIPYEDGSFGTRHVGGGAIYEITYVDETVARTLAKARPAHPLGIWNARHLGVLSDGASPAIGDGQDDEAIDMEMPF